MCAAPKNVFICAFEWSVECWDGQSVCTRTLLQKRSKWGRGVPDGKHRHSSTGVRARRGIYKIHGGPKKTKFWLKLCHSV